MADPRKVRIAVIAVWTVAICLVVGLAFVRGTAPVSLTTVRNAADTLPVMYEFSTDT